MTSQSRSGDPGRSPGPGNVRHVAWLVVLGIAFLGQSCGGGAGQGRPADAIGGQGRPEAGSGPPPVPLGTADRAGVTYYIAPISTSGDGTLSNPFGLPDLLTAVPNGNVTQGRALTILQPGDTLDFLAGTYDVAGSFVVGSWNAPLLSPTVSGTPTQPITLRAAPGAAVNIVCTAGNQPVFGTSAPLVNYVRFLGFSVDPGPGVIASDGTPLVPFDFYISGTGDEVGYCEIVGHYVASTQNHTGIRVDFANAAWIHNNYIRDFQGLDPHSCGEESYDSSNCIFDDNYIANCTGAAFQDKDPGPNNPGENNIYRRNWVVNCGMGWQGANQNATQVVQVYDNVFQNSGRICNANFGNVGSSYYNNLVILGPQALNTNLSANFVMTGGQDSNGPTYLQNLWNNVVLYQGVTGAATFNAYNAPWITWAASGSTAPLQYMDYNIYDESSVVYNFASGVWFTFNPAGGVGTIQSQGFETHSSTVTSGAVVYPGMASGDYTLATAYRTAGRYGDPVGPRVPISGPGGLMDATRYGPGALSTGTSPAITQQPGNQTVSAGGTATFGVRVNGSGLFYQWERSNDGGNTWLPIQGANSAAYTTSQLSTSDNGAIFRCLVSSVGGSAWSGMATLTVRDAVAAPARSTK